MCIAARMPWCGLRVSRARFKARGAAAARMGGRAPRRPARLGRPDRPGLDQVDALDPLRAARRAHDPAAVATPPSPSCRPTCTTTTGSCRTPPPDSLAHFARQRPELAAWLVPELRTLTTSRHKSVARARAAKLLASLGAPPSHNPARIHWMHRLCSSMEEQFRPKERVGGFESPPGALVIPVGYSARRSSSSRLRSPSSSSPLPLAGKSVVGDGDRSGQSSVQSRASKSLYADTPLGYKLR